MLGSGSAGWSTSTEIRSRGCKDWCRSGALSALEVQLGPFREFCTLSETSCGKEDNEKAKMPLLNWSSGALAAVKNKDCRSEMTRLFNAYFRVAEAQSLTGSILYLDLPGSHTRYHFHAKFTETTGWVVQTELKQEDRKVLFKFSDSLVPRF
jgi:hypothetical protein